jgi:NAD(P)-dependent dehydrogenase (short-subunit alcohol dehydrogenase family)
LSVSVINKDSVLLFTGGAKGITARCALALARQMPCTYLLMGRSQIKEDPVWADGIDGEAALKQAAVEALRKAGEQPAPQVVQKLFNQVIGSREIRQTLAQLRACGATADYLAADVTDREAVQAQIQVAQTQYGMISGVVHGAGRLADKRIERKALQDFQAVYGTKVVGLENVLSSLDPANLRLLVLFSSVAGAFGNLGQTDYAMANEALNKFSYQFQHQYPHCRVLALNWGPWDSGMVNAELKKAFAARGITLITEEEGAALFTREVLGHNNPPSPQIVIGSSIDLKSDPLDLPPGASWQVKRSLDPQQNPFLFDHQIGENRVLPASCGAAWMADTCEQLFHGYHFFEMTDFKVLKGVVFADDQPQAYEVRVQAMESGTADALHLAVEIFSSGAKSFRHYSAHVGLRQQIPEPPERTEALPSFAPEDYQRAQQAYRTRRLFHGPAFRGLQALGVLRDDGFQALVNLAAFEPHKQGQFLVRATHPFLNDVVLQSMLLWTLDITGAACLPAGIQHLRQYKKLRFDQDYYIDTDVREYTTSRIIADAFVYDQHGRLCLRAEGVEGTLSTALLPLFEKSRTSLDMHA